MNIDALVESLRSTKKAELEMTPNRPDKACRSILIEAAKEAGVRISMKTTREEGNDRVEARVLSPAEAAARRRKETLFTGINKIRTGVQVLADGTIDTDPIADQLDDLRDIIEELDEYSQKYSGATR